MSKSFFLIFLLLGSMTASAVVVEEILARVGNEIITKSDYEKETNRLYQELSRYNSGEQLQQRFSEQKKILLDLMINQKLLDQKAKELGISVEEEINAAIKRLREENNIPDDQALEAALKQEGSSIAELREDFRKRIVQQRILWNYVQGKVNITEEEIKSYYEQHKSEMMTEKSTKVIRYVISDPDTDKETLKIEAESVLKVLRAGQELKKSDFTHLRIDESAEFLNSEIDPKLSEALDAIEVGTYTDSIEITNGWIILKLEERREAKPIPFEEARGKIYNLLLQQRAEKYQKSFLEDLRKQNYVVINQKPS